MTEPGDQARISVYVDTGVEDAFRVFTEEIDQWWRRGVQYRVAGARRGFLRLEAGVGGRLFESFDDGDDTRVVETGHVLLWQPPNRLRFEWRSVTFAPSERTFVDVDFQPSADGTLVTVTHSGWRHIRADHPVRHGREGAAFVRMMGLWWAELLSSMREHVGRH